MLWIIGGIALIAVLSTTAESRAEAKEKLARWNPLFIAIIIAEVAIVLYPWASAPR